MRFDPSPMIPVSLALRRTANARRDYAARTHAANRARQLRQIAWSVLSAAALLWFWDLSVRLDAAVQSHVTETLR